MRGIVKAGMTACLVLGLAGFALAQRPGGGFFAGAGTLLRNPDVQKELKITDEQKEKLKDALGKVIQDHRDELAKLQGASEEERRKTFQKIGEESNKAISGILDAKQVKRLDEIRLQVGGPVVFADPKVQEKLKLSDEQKGKMREIGEASFKKMRGLFQGGPSEEAQKKAAELNKETLDKLLAVLTDEQKKTWKEMTGAPFELKREAPRRNR